MSQRLSLAPFMKSSESRDSRTRGPRSGGLVRRHSDLVLADLVLAALVAAVVAMMIVPLPTAALDLLLALNIALSVVLLMVAVHVRDAMRIAAFPTILLIATLFRLGLNVSTTRLILARGDAGDVVASFGSFVVADNLVVGVVVFAIITIIQFAVVARGSERVAEVAARFALDAMPGQQMAIDADVRAGLLDASQAGARRAALQRRSQLYGAMDGAMKFIKGDAIAAVLITLINLIGGLVVGIGYGDMSASEAASLYSMLSIGDGLVAQLPALLLALAAGLIVTRVASDDEGAHLGHEIVTQVIAQPRAIAVAGVLLVGLGVVPGLPTVAFVTLGAGCVLVALLVARRPEERPEFSHRRAITSAAAPGASTVIADAEIIAGPEAAIVVEIAAPHARSDARADTPSNARSLAETMARALDSVRQQIHDEFGVKLPAIAVRSDAAQATHLYRLRLFGLVVDGDSPDPPPPDPPLQAPVDDSTDRSLDNAELVQILGRIRRALVRHASAFVGIQETRALIDDLASEQPVLVREVVPALVGLPLLSQVLCRLVSERISIRDLAAVLQASARWSTSATGARRDPAAVTESVRSGLGHQISAQYAADGSLSAWFLDPMVEDALRDSLTDEFAALEPDLADEILAAIRTTLTSVELPSGDHSPVVLASPDIRRHAAGFIRSELPDVVVLSPAELLPGIRIDARGPIGVS